MFVGIFRASWRSMESIFASYNSTLINIHVSQKHYNSETEALRNFGSDSEVGMTNREISLAIIG